MAGYIGAKAVGLNVTTGDILGDVGVGGDVDLLQAKHIRFRASAGGTIRGSISAESDDKLQFSTGASETARMTIDTSGNVGIGDVPAGNLTAGYALRLDGGAQTFLAFNNNTHTTQVTGGFVIGNDSGAARITQRESQHVLFEVGGSEVLTLEVNKNVTIEDGNLVVASGHGIDFSATADGAGTDTSELLDDYEEGTWTPTYRQGSNNPAAYATQYGYYTKVGGVVHASGYLTVNGLASMSGNLVISGLPYTIQNLTSNFSSVNVGYYENLNLPTANTTVMGYSNANTVDLNLRIGNGTASSAAMTAAQLSANGGMIFAVTYRAA